MKAPKSQQVRRLEAVIGLEVHVQLSTASKIFCSCPARLPATVSVSEIEANSHVCPICTGHPGTLPVLNRKVVEFAIQAGLATQCAINPKSLLARKNYFYPDLPKGYQISQYDEPMCRNGVLGIQLPNGEEKRVRIHRIHIEEDAGKSIHYSGFSVLNLNRAGVPLVEIVSEPDMASPAEAGAYLRELHSVVTFLGISDGNMEEGNFRCDANVSVREPGAELGTRVEIKNVNSFKFIEKAIEFEVLRQSEVLRSGGTVIQETRSFDSFRGTTVPMRSKEEAEDYRYFPDPDLIPIYVDGDWIEELKKRLPELPQQRRGRYVATYGLSAYDAGLLTSSREIAEFYDQVMEVLKKSTVDAELTQSAKTAANWVCGEVLRMLNETGQTLQTSKLTPHHLAELVRLLQLQQISSTGAKQIFGKVWETGKSVSEVIQGEGLVQISDPAVLKPIIDKIIAAFPGQVAEYRSGKDKLIGFFVGQVMKETQGKANPTLVNEWVRQALSSG
ncbi:MAG: Asp-tRNA(Asn)/Glu-tRNA(Gln) amidotransferase subunit GatB [Bdellovibrio sp.]|nr:Asp-tRNA(Asn)/Glu-tRNA(Gln) amidotransferase subunit GatB [Bdellovibrio sp.]